MQKLLLTLAIFNTFVNVEVFFTKFSWLAEKAGGGALALFREYKKNFVKNSTLMEVLGLMAKMAFAPQGLVAGRSIPPGLSLLTITFNYVILLMLQFDLKERRKLYGNCKRYTVYLYNR
jgi:hypothetical protein